MSDEVEMERDQRVFSTTDAGVWADEFLAAVEEGAVINFGLMVGWFANAIETGRAAGARSGSG